MSAALADVPSVDYQEQIQKLCLKAAVDALPEKVQSIYEDVRFRDYIHIDHTYRRLPSGGYINVPVPCMPQDTSWLTPALEKKVSDLMNKSNDQLNKQSQLRQKLKAAAYGCTTVKQLRELLPDFAKYLPEEVSSGSSSRSLPVVTDIVESFRQAGWPKDQAA